MFNSTVKTFNLFPQITARIERAAAAGLDAAAREAASVAQAGASIDLKLHVVPVHGDVDGYSAGIKARKQTRTVGKTTPIALFFDQGTLGRRSKPLKRARKQSWTVKNRSGAIATATRHDTAGKGIPAEHFFPKARAAGRRKLLAQIKHEL